MRIQHNIMAMNAYRNYTNNTSALSKNLEKLSSGYKINRAGDDAAGLAISEKMRAQITGLETAQKNAKDGISLVQTAEGALTEVHDMLNRMVELADQSANGTYQDEVDRENLQAELEQLKSEINRIADSSNFNGIKLLDGKLAGSATVGEDFTTLTTSEVTAVAGKYSADLTGLGAMLNAEGAKGTLELTFSNGQKVTVELERAADVGGKAVINMKVNGKDAGKFTSAAADATDTELSTHLATALGTAVKGFATVANGTGKLNFTSSVEGTDGVSLTGATYNITKSDNTVSTGSFSTKTTTPAADAKLAIASSELSTYNGTNLDDAKFTFNGKDYVIVTNAADAAKLEGVTALIGDPTADQESIAAQLSKASGVEVTWDANNTRYLFSADLSKSSGASSGGLTLQIGDTSETFNQLTVQIQDMHASSLGIADIDIGTQKGAQEAVELIKSAINTVSSVRGDLGATQNRLDHTINNLSVMTENIQDAESTIRDTDVADEMMAYTKNNILVQSAQAMLAQANQVPQGVLQLLQ